MKEKVFKETITKEKVIYIADDGTEFDIKRQCEMHEFYNYLETLYFNSQNIEFFDDIEDNPWPGRYDIEELEDFYCHGGNHAFLYVKAINKNGIDELNNLIKLYADRHLKHKMIPDYLTDELICIEYFKDGNGYIEFNCMENDFDDLNEFYDKIGYEVILRPQAQSNASNKPLNAERIEQIIYKFVADNYGDNEAYAPCYNLREMAFEIANLYNDKNYSPDFTPRYGWDKEKEEE